MFAVCKPFLMFFKILHYYDNRKTKEMWCWKESVQTEVCPQLTCPPLLSPAPVWEAEEENHIISSSDSTYCGSCGWQCFCSLCLTSCVFCFCAARFCRWWEAAAISEKRKGNYYFTHSSFKLMKTELYLKVWWLF